LTLVMKKVVGEPGGADGLMLVQLASAATAMLEAMMLRRRFGFMLSPPGCCDWVVFACIMGSGSVVQVREIPTPCGHSRSAVLNAPA
jgi:hypothetical protein